MKIRHILAISGLVVATLAAGSTTAAADEMRGDRHDGGTVTRVTGTRVTGKCARKTGVTATGTG